MKRYELFLYIICFAILGCRGQDGNADMMKNNAGISFEEKQKADLAKIENELTFADTTVNFNFRMAARKVTPGVVHIRSTYSIHQGIDSPHQLSDDFWYRFFSEVPEEKPQADASGVVISSDGYIVTNSHVVEDAEDIEITLQDQRSYKAIIVGIDPETDMALLKINETNLSFVEFGDSDDIEVGDWVLAVGNPFNLTSTVTAGIVSAKARDINVRKGGKAESYIQTDAAVNRGNSGGALVDFNGKLIGINSIIATPTGAYAGYSFSTPVNTVKKVVEDLRINGKVQRGYLGLIYKNMSAAAARELNTDITTGVYIDSILSGGAAMESEVKLHDIIVAIDDHKVITASQLQEIIDRHRPTEKITLTVIRKGKEKRIPITLKSVEGVFPKTVSNKGEVLRKLGIKVAELTEDEKNQMKLKSGMKVIDIAEGEINSYTNIKKGFIILKVNGEVVKNEKDLVKAFDNKKGTITMEGVYPDLPAIIYYTFDVE